MDERAMTSAVSAEMQRWAADEARLRRVGTTVRRLQAPARQVPTPQRRQPSRLREILAGLSAEDIREAIVAGAFFSALIWHLPLIIAVLDAAFGGAR